MRPSPPLPNPSELARRQRVTQRIWDDEAYDTSGEYSGRVGIPDEGYLDYDDDGPTRVLPGRLPHWSDDVDAPTLSDLRRSSPLVTRKLAARPFGGRPSFLYSPYGQSPTTARVMLLTGVLGMGVVLVGVIVAFGLGLLGGQGDAAQNNAGAVPVATTAPTATLAPTATSTPLPAVAASFASQDTSLQGNWKPQYGSQGYIVVGDDQQLPAAVQVTPTHQQETVWQSSTTDPRALQKVTDPTDRVAACWYADSSFTIDVNVTDGQTYQLALYFLDWDQQNRAEIINTVDPTTNALLDTRVVTSFTNGTYVVWNVRGHIAFQITAAPGSVNAVVSGVFIAPVATPGSTPVATPTNAATATPVSSPDATPTDTPAA